MYIKPILFLFFPFCSFEPFFLCVHEIFSIYIFWFSFTSSVFYSFPYQYLPSFQRASNNLYENTESTSSISTGKKAMFYCADFKIKLTCCEEIMLRFATGKTLSVSLLLRVGFFLQICTLVAFSCTYLRQAVECSLNWKIWNCSGKGILRITSRSSSCRKSSHV